MQNSLLWCDPMKQSIANLVRSLLVLLLFVPAPIAMASPPPALADVSVQVVAAEPAVEVPEVVEEAEEQPWTQRFLAPAMVVLGAVAVGAAASYYVVRIRGRYRLAE